MNTRERKKIRKYLQDIKLAENHKNIDLKVDLIAAIVDIDEQVHRYKADNINKTRSLGKLNEFGRLK